LIFLEALPALFFSSTEMSIGPQKINIHGDKSSHYPIIDT